MGVLDDKVAIVTGSARGIGKATAELLSEHGAKVVVNDLDGDAAQETADAIAGETAVYARRPHQRRGARRARPDAIDAWGKIDIIVNNAGYTLDAPIHKMSDDWFQKMLDIHLVVALPRHPRRRAAPARAGQGRARARRGGLPQDRQRLLDRGTMGNAGQANYSAGKARRRRPDQDAGQGVGSVQGQRQRGRLRLDRDAPDRLQGRRQRDGDPTARRSSSASPSRCAAWPRRSSPSAARAPPRRRRAASSSSARRGPTTSTARCSTSPVASSRA